MMSFSGLENPDEGHVLSLTQLKEHLQLLYHILFILDTGLFQVQS